MSEYQSANDFLIAPRLLALAKEEGEAFITFDKAAKRTNGIIPPKTREFISLAVALTTQCPYCLDVHTRAAKKAGATAEEIAELITIAAAVRAGATMGYGLMTLRLYEEA